jgi:hypothetical protein
MANRAKTRLKKKLPLTHDVNHRARHAPYDAGTLNNLPITTTESMAYPHTPKCLSPCLQPLRIRNARIKKLCTRVTTTYAENIFATLDSPTENTRPTSAEQTKKLVLTRHPSLLHSSHPLRGEPPGVVRPHTPQRPALRSRELSAPVKGRVFPYSFYYVCAARPR